MRSHWRSYLAISFMAMSTGCATQGIQQATTFAKAGTDYGDAVIEFLDVYLVTRIDTNSKSLLVTRKVKLEAQLGAELPQELEKFDSRALTAVRATAQLRNNVRLLRAYFENLNALATSNLPEEGGAALKSLGEAISDVNAVTGRDAQTFTAAQLGSIEKIGKLAVKAAVSAKVKEALQRDKETIAWQLAWQESMLRTLVAPVKEAYELELKEFRAEKVARPYGDPSSTLGAPWINDRRMWAQSHFMVESFDKAQRAAAHMRSVWEDIISGQNDVQSIRLILADLKEFTGIVRAYDEAEKKK